jgi:hypothetical protein
LKWYLSIGFSAIFFSRSLYLVAQSSYATLSVDNDLYFKSDYYYSSGIFWQYGKEISAQSSESLKTYHLWELSQEIYNPSKRYTSNTALFDYPYGGWSYIKYTIQKEIRPLQYVEYGVQVGTTGDWSLAPWIQNTYHEKVLMLRPNSWVAQVPNSIHVNLFLGYFYEQVWSEIFRFQSHFYSRLGTQRIDAGSRVGINIGQGKVLPLGSNNLQPHTPFPGLYFGVDGSWIAHDYMLNGSLFGKEAPFTAPLMPFRIIYELGITLQSKKWKALMLYKHRSRDNKLQPRQGHEYINFSISRFFR